MKKFLLILLMFCLVFVAGCGNSNQENSSSNTAQTGKNEIEVLQVVGKNNSISLSIKEEENVKYKFLYYVDSNPLLVDKELTKSENGVLTCKILGLKAGKNKVEIIAEKNGETTKKIIDDVEVNQTDISGYAHFNNPNGIGAYNDDGTLKSNAKIIYLSNENKNTVTEKIGNTYPLGIVQILQNLRFSTTPVVIRVLDNILTNQWKYKSAPPRLIDDSNLTADFFENTFETTYGENVVGLTNNVKNARDGVIYKYVTTKTGVKLSSTGTTKTATVKYSRNDYPEIKGKTVYSDDSGYNMVQVKNAKNVTIEGVFEGAGLFQWGINFSKCNGIEVRNLVFDSYTEDALSFNGESGSSASASSLLDYPYKGFFVHHNTFKRGKNNWDITGERDKYAGDGTIDLNESANVTIAYNQIINGKKTILISSSDENKTNNVTMHHNYFYKCESRLPFSRHTNIHTYNNYYNECSSCVQIQANGYLFSENNFYNNCKKTLVVKTAITNDKSAVKSFNDVFSNCQAIGGTIVLNREDYVENSCDTRQNFDYSTFDVNPELFYYDQTNKCSKVSIMHNANEIPLIIQSISGAKN